MASPQGRLDSDYKLVDESQERSFDCPVCLQFLGDPCTTQCCKKDFCRSCIVKIRKSGGQCPLCRDSQFKTKKNTSLDRKVFHLQVYCANRSKGCEWIGDLGEVEVHINLNPVARYQSKGCQFVDVQCEYCSTNYPRQEILEHLSHCPRRPFICEYCCKYESHYDDVSNHHWKVCTFYPTLCPNGCDESVPRRNIEEHISKDCPMTITECDFKPYGCKERLPRIEMQTHMKYSVAAHESLKMMARVVKQLKTQDRNIRELETKLDEKYKKLVKERKDLTILERKISSMKSEVSALCKTVEQQNERLKQLEAQFTSKTYNDDHEILWERFRHVLIFRDNMLRRQIMQCVREYIDEQGITIHVVHHYCNPVVKVIVQLFNIDRKYVIAVCLCLVIGLVAIIHWLLF